MAYRSSVGVQKVFCTVKKLFVLGLPGSGKSTISRNIVVYVKQHHPNWFSERVGDYQILQKMFQEDTEQEFFNVEQPGGFYIHNSSVYNIALKKLQENVLSLQYKQNSLIIIEFARSDYKEAFNHLKHEFLRDAYFLFLHAKIDICKSRVSNRFIRQDYPSDDHFVPDRTFEAYSGKNNEQYFVALCSSLRNEYGIDHQNMRILDMGSTEKDIVDAANHFIDLILQQKADTITSSTE